MATSQEVSKLICCFSFTLQEYQMSILTSISMQCMGEYTYFLFDCNMLNEIMEIGLIFSLNS